MDITDALSIVQQTLTEERYEHTVRVVDQARRFADLYDFNPDQVVLAAAFHDYAKEHDLALMKRMICSSMLPKDLLHYHPELWHGPVGSILVYDEFGITDPGVRSAIRYHTTGKIKMSQLEMVVFLADYVEPKRQFPGLDEVRQVAREDLSKATWLVLRNTIQYLTERGRKIYPDTFYAYNDLMK